MRIRPRRFAWPLVVAATALAAGSRAAAEPQAPAVRPAASNAFSSAETTSLEGGRVIFGPPPPIEPEVITRDDQGRATLRAVRLTEPLHVDGRLDEAIYSTLKPITGFVQSVPDIGKPVSERTEAWVLFDRANLYIACRCWDSAGPSRWVANEMRHDGAQLHQNDNFGILLDSFYDRRNGIHLSTNPLGGMLDTQLTNEGNPNTDWNAVWNVRTARFDGGWSVEMQVPFKSLQYQPGLSQIWGLQIRRGIRRRNEWSFLTPLPPEGPASWQHISMSPTLVGVEVPQGTKNVDVKPYAIGGLRTDRTAATPIENDPSGEFGFDVKYGVTQNLTLDLTYNTDFAQVEADEQQINLTRFNLVFPEKREFFLENRGLFEFGRGTRAVGVSTAVPNLFFTRQIGLNAGRIIPIFGGARLTGKVGKFSVGAMNLQTDSEAISKTDKTNFTVLRLRRDLLRRSNAGIMFTNRSSSVVVPGASNQAYGADASFSFYRNVNLTGFYARTQTEGLSGNPESYQAHFDYSPDRYGVVAEHQLVGDAFNPEVGFVQRPNERRSFVLGRFSPRPKSIHSVRQFDLEGTIEYIENIAGRLETRQDALTFSTEFQSSDRFSVEYDRNYELLSRPFRVSRDVTIPAGGYDFNTMQTIMGFGQQRKASGSVTFTHGGFYDGTQNAVNLRSGRIEITPQFSVEPSLSVNRIELPYGKFTTELYRARTTYTFSPRMFISALVQYNTSNNTTSTNARLRWEYSPASEFFIVYTEDRDTRGPLAGQLSPVLNRGLVLKFNRMIRF